jgi:hypothetical protein
MALEKSPFHSNADVNSLQYFPSAFDDSVVVPPVEHGDKSKCVGRRRQRVDLPDLFHFCDRFLNAVPLRQIHPMPKESPGSTGIQLLRGAVSGTLLGPPQLVSGTVVFHVQHHWVTESGDMLTFDPAVATTAPISQTLFAVITYPVQVTGGTGKFAGATAA